jgi:hypothetical protein
MLHLLCIRGNQLFLLGEFGNENFSGQDKSCDGCGVLYSIDGDLGGE